MKTLLLLRLGIILFVAAQPVLAADAAKGTNPGSAKSAEVKAAKPPEAVARHDRELQEVAAKVEVLFKGFPLLAGPAGRQREAEFQAELAKLKGAPEFKRPVPVASAPGKALHLKPAGQFRAEGRAADLALMRKQADKVLASRPELRAYVEQQFEWHRRVFELGDQYPDNPKAHRLLAVKLSSESTPQK